MDEEFVFEPRRMRFWEEPGEEEWFAPVVSGLERLNMSELLRRARVLAERSRHGVEGAVGEEEPVNILAQAMLAYGEDLVRAVGEHPELAEWLMRAGPVTARVAAILVEKAVAAGHRPPLSDEELRRYVDTVVETLARAARQELAPLPPRLLAGAEEAARRSAKELQRFLYRLKSSGHALTPEQYYALKAYLAWRGLLPPSALAATKPLYRASQALREAVEMYRQGRPVKEILGYLERLGWSMGTKEFYKLLRRGGAELRRRFRRLTEEEKKQILEEYKKGTPIAEIAEKHRVSKATISRIVREMGAEPSRGRRLTDEDRRRIVEEYKRGARVAELAKRYGVSRATIYNILKKAGALERRRKK